MLQLHMQADGRSCLPGLTLLPAPDSISVQRVLHQVKQRRVTARTNMNACSSQRQRQLAAHCVAARHMLIPELKSGIVVPSS